MDRLYFKNGWTVNLLTGRFSNDDHVGNVVGVDHMDCDINTARKYVRACTKAYQRPENGLSGLLEFRNLTECYWVFVGISSIVDSLISSLGSYCVEYSWDDWMTKTPSDVHNSQIVFVRNTKEINHDHTNSFVGNVIVVDGSVIRCNVRIVFCAPTCPKIVPVDKAEYEFGRMRFHELIETDLTCSNVELIHLLVHEYRKRKPTDDLTNMCHLLHLYERSFTKEMLFVRDYLKKDVVTAKWKDSPEFSESQDPENFSRMWEYFFRKFSPNDRWI